MSRVQSFTSMVAWPKSEAAKCSFTVSERFKDAQKGSLK